MLTGTVGMLGSCVYLWFAIGDEPSLGAVLIGGTLLGITSGLVMPAFIATTLLGVPSDQHSVGSSINFMAQRTSATLGTALAITFLAGAAGSTGLHHSILVGVICTIGGLVLVFVLDRPSHDLEHHRSDHRRSDHTATQGATDGSHIADLPTA
jgi:MFS family permease